MPVRLNGSTSGYVELAAPAVAGTTSLELPTDSIKPGMVLVAAQSFSAVSSVSVNNCFSATYDAYRIVINTSSSSTNNSTQFRLRVSGTDASGGNYNQYALSADATAVTVNSGTGNTLFTVSTNSSTNGGIAALEVVRPALAVHTGILLTSSNWSAGAYGAGLVLHQVNTAYDGFSLIASTGTITGSLQVFGYRKTV